MSFESGLPIRFLPEGMYFEYGQGAFGCAPERRRLDAIRASLSDPYCSGPDPVYIVAMDVGRQEDRVELERRMLLFGVVAYAAGTLGQELVRSQGHVHAVSRHCGWSTPEIFEIWQGNAIVYAQEGTTYGAGCCVAVEAGPGEQVVVPPGWAHCVMNADPASPMVFGACCDRQYGFVYDAVRARGGLAWRAVLDETGTVRWERNPNYMASTLIRHPARTYPELGLTGGMPLYKQFAQDPESMQWVSDPARLIELWPAFRP